jgi:hypothetical protein
MTCRNNNKRLPHGKFVYDANQNVVKIGDTIGFSGSIKTAIIIDIFEETPELRRRVRLDRPVLGHEIVPCSFIETHGYVVFTKDQDQPVHPDADENPLATAEAGVVSIILAALAIVALVLALVG